MVYGSQVGLCGFTRVSDGGVMVYYIREDGGGGL